MDQSWVKLEPNLGQIRPKLAQNTNWTRVPILIVETTDYRPHCSVSLYLFHGQITQKAVHQLSDPENKKCSHWKFFGTIYLQTLWFLSRRGPRSPDMGLSQHYIGSEMTFCHFSNFCRKKFSSLTKKLLHISIQIWGLKFAKTMWLDFYNHSMQKISSVKPGNFFLQKFGNVGISFLADVMLRRSHVWAFRASLAQKLQGLRMVCSKKFSMATFFFPGSLS